MQKSIGIYIHIPFCAQKCNYCDFYSMPCADSDFMRTYADALIGQIKSKKRLLRNRHVSTIYIGGGTPSLMPPEYIVNILNAVKSTAVIDQNAEITIEANPGTLDGAKLTAYRNAGVNRLSLGLQSADDDELKMLGRIHTKDDFANSFAMARMEGFTNISVDVMYALPHQTEETLYKTLEFVAALEPEHISFYGLKIEQNTPFGDDEEIKKALPDEDTQYNMYMKSCKLLESHGYEQYEISNFSKKGYESRHNKRYWLSKEYIGFGPAAHSFFDMRMYGYKKDVNAFITGYADENALIDEDYTLTNRSFAVQYVMLAFRLRDGVNTAKYRELFGREFDDEYLPRMKVFIEKQFIAKTDTGYCLTRRGMMISNYILSEILDFTEG
ncbi:MAG: radical SAM family heme chaperone HemW [Clostridia bacterium]|nr:radical SAM family heme chaperone HemW [Clostridia bacterium]